MNLSHFADFCQQAVKDGILFYYTGEFSQNVIGAMTDTLKQRLDAVGVGGPLRRKIFSSFIEMSQNIMHYANGESSGTKIGALAVGHAPEGKYFIICGNSVLAEHVDRIRSKVEPLRSMTTDEIKAAYREQLRSETHDEEDTISRGAGLGFLTVAREASEPIEYEIIFRSNDQEYAEFYLRAAI